MNFSETFTFRLLQISNAYRNNLQKAMNEMNLHSGQIFILVELWKLDGQSQIELVRTLSLAAPTVHKMVKSLEKNEFVESRRCESDTRMVRVYLTEKGKRHEELAIEQWKNLDSQMLFNLTETEKLIFLQLFDKLKGNLGDFTPISPGAE